MVTLIDVHMCVTGIYLKGITDNGGEIYTVCEQFDRSSERKIYVKIYVNVTSNFFPL